MWERLKDTFTRPRNRDLALLTGGMLGLSCGAKATPAALFALGLKGLEDSWRKDHPEFNGSFTDRWRAAIEFYDATHQDPTNRILHTVGIPMILGGFVGMLASPRYSPLWWASNGSWVTGWALNLIGHGLFEKGPPAFADDPLSFVAGPVWDFVRIRDRVRAQAPATPEVSPAHPPTPL